MNRQWFVNRTNTEFVDYLSRTCSISPLITQILINRGIKTPSDIYSFLNPDINRLSDPFELRGMKSAVDRILQAKKNRERVMIHGDYDADGITSTVLLLSAFHDMGIESYYFIPDRMLHGYGFGICGVERAKEIGASLIVTVDCGITSFEAVSLCKKNGIDVIITDHHEPFLKDVENLSSVYQNDTTSKFLLPDALSVVNPKIMDSNSPLNNLSGAGVALKLLQALDAQKELGIPYDYYFDIASMGTLADIVPLTYENRVIVKEGLKKLQKSIRPGLKALIEISGVSNRALKTGTVIFSLIPRINSAGRISNADQVIKLFLTESEDEAFNLAKELNLLNAKRQQIEEDVFHDALNQLKKKDLRSVIVLSSEGWHKGVIGIVASRIAEIYNRPAFIISKDDRVSRGSGRSIPSFDLCESLTLCAHILRGFGGHKSAAGIEIETDKINDFEEIINRIAFEKLNENDFSPVLQIDAEAKLSDLGFNIIRDIELLEPFGCGNPEPVIGSRNLDVLYPRIIKDSHIKMKLRQNGQSIDAVGFDMALDYGQLLDFPKIDAAYRPLINEWEGKQFLQLRLKALRKSRNH
ncbi:MAG: single-stranded-DNA-specific exonuclease RecJ [Nitrospirae bacterium]|jgi:single-stranded-DNA-specific exonuclease|nr:single-stranded-DNA-specific exonuclease RecJ [Nitrospirota bacterium]